MNDTANVWNNTRPMREVRYLMQSSVPSWPGFMNRFLSGPGIASLVNTTSNGPALLFPPGTRTIRGRDICGRTPTCR